MFMYNIVGTQKGEPFIATRIADESQQKLIVTKNHLQMTEFVTNGDNITFTQTIEFRDGEETSTVVDSIVWSPHGPLMRTQDARLRFLRFTQRDSIMFVGIDKETRFLVEVQLASNKFTHRTHSEMHFCKPVAADAIDKYIWIINTDNAVEVHNVADKESYTMKIAPHWEPHAILGMSSDGRSAIVVATHATKHYAAMLSYELTSNDLLHTDTREVLSSMRFQPGTMVQSKGCVMFTVKNAAAQKQHLVTIGNYNGNVFFQTAEINLAGLNVGAPVTKFVFSDIAMNNSVLYVSLLINRNLYGMWSFNMHSSKVFQTKIFGVPEGLSDFIIDRVVLMRDATQVQLETLPSSTLVSAHVTDMITTRMRHQLEIATNTARSMVGTSRNAADMAKSVAAIKELGVMREANEQDRRRLEQEHDKAIKRLTKEHAAAALQMELQLKDVTTQRDARVAMKQFNSIKTQLENTQRDKVRLEQALETARKENGAAQSSAVLEVRQLQQRISALTTERDGLKSDVTAFRGFVSTATTERDAARTELRAQKTDLQKQVQLWQHQAGVLSMQVGALEQQAANRARDTAEMQRREHDLSAENLLISAQLAELRTRMADSEQVKQMTMQLDAAQARSRMQYEALQREIDSLRRANYTLSQSYQMLQSVTKFGFLPDGTSLETALQMMRNLTVFQQDLATLREENTILRKKAAADV
jgi:hypothetical protein